MTSAVRCQNPEPPCDADLKQVPLTDDDKEVEGMPDENTINAKPAEHPLPADDGEDARLLAEVTIHAYPAQVPLPAEHLEDACLVTEVTINACSALVSPQGNGNHDAWPLAQPTISATSADNDGRNTDEVPPPAASRDFDARTGQHPDPVPEADTSRPPVSLVDENSDNESFYSCCMGADDEPTHPVDNDSSPPSPISAGTHPEFEPICNCYADGACDVCNAPGWPPTQTLVDSTDHLDRSGNLFLHLNQGQGLERCRWHLLSNREAVHHSSAGPEIMVTTPEGENFWPDDLTYYVERSRATLDDEDKDEDEGVYD